VQLGQAIHDFISALELKDKEQEDASGQHVRLREGLTQRLDLDPNFLTFLTGSYKRRTAIRPLKDIDVFCVLKRSTSHDPRTLTPSAALRQVKAALDAAYPGKAAEPQNRSVNIEFSGTGIAYDVVPAFAEADGDSFMIPDIGAASWIRSNPRVHEARSVAANEATGSELKPLTKAVKHWNRHLPKAERLRSFHIEVMAWDVLRSKPDSRAAGLLALYRGLATRVLTPTLDPAGFGPAIDADVSYQTRAEAQKRFAAVADKIQEAIALAGDGKSEAAHHRLYQIFQDPYPERGRAESSSGPRIVVGSAPDSGPRHG
jgi:hypothetical protein